MSAVSVLCVAFGGAFGALARFWISALVGTERFPWATLAINIAGSFAIGLLWGAFAHQPWFAAWGRTLLVVGLLGGFTTYSAFSLETLLLAETGRPFAAAGYVVSTMFGALLAVWVGQRVGSW